jgi:hypothetical protein
MTEDTIKIKRDLERRKRTHLKRMNRERELERFVRNIRIDWAEFHRRLEEALGEITDGCNHDYDQGRQILAGQGLDDEAIEAYLWFFRLQHGCRRDHTQCRQILAGMGLDDEVIEACLWYFSLQCGDCDCKVAFNVDMTDPQPMDFSCADCGYDYDEYYMVHDDIWQTHGVGDGMLCIGCLEKRLGRQLCRQDFTGGTIDNSDSGRKSLRLRDRLTRNAASLESAA